MVFSWGEVGRGHHAHDAGVVPSRNGTRVQPEPGTKAALLFNLFGTHIQAVGNIR